MNVDEKIMSLTELMGLLDYEDPRSAVRWCDKNEVPVNKYGKKCFVHRWLVAMAFDRHVIVLARAKGIDEYEVMDALANDDKEKFAELFGAPLSLESRRGFRQTRRGPEKDVYKILAS